MSCIKISSPVFSSRHSFGSHAHKTLHQGHHKPLLEKLWMRLIHINLLVYIMY